MPPPFRDSAVRQHRHRMDLLAQPVPANKPGKPLTMEGPSAAVRTPDPTHGVLLTDNLWRCEYDGSQTPAPYSHNRRFNYLFFDGPRQELPAGKRRILSGMTAMNCRPVRFDSRIPSQVADRTPKRYPSALL